MLLSIHLHQDSVMPVALEGAVARYEQILAWFSGVPAIASGKLRIGP